MIADWQLCWRANSACVFLSRHTSYISFIFTYLSIPIHVACIHSFCAAKIQMMHKAKGKLMLEQNTKTCGKTLSENQLKKKWNKKKNGIQQLFQLKLRVTCCCTATMQHTPTSNAPTNLLLSTVYKYTSHNCNQNIYLLPTSLLQMFLLLVRI